MATRKRRGKRKTKIKLNGTQMLAGTAGVWVLVAWVSGGWMPWLVAGLFSAAAGLSHVKGQRPPARRPASGRRPAAGRRPAQAPLANHGQRVKRAPVFGTVKCSAACRSSRKSAYDSSGVLRCDCPCGGREHGKYRPGTAAAIRGAQPTAAQKASDRRARTAEDNRRYSERQERWGADALEKARRREARQAERARRRTGEASA